MTLPSVATVITQYLYGSSLVPTGFSDESLVRDASDSSSISIDVVDYMENGPGRFALAANFSLIKQFMTAPRLVLEELFDQKYVGSNDEIVLRKSDMLTYYNFDYIGLSVDQKDWNDGSDSYVDRACIWRNTSFQINNGAEFIIKRSFNSDGIAIYEQA